MTTEEPLKSIAEYDKSRFLLLRRRKLRKIMDYLLSNSDNEDIYNFLESLLDNKLERWQQTLILYYLHQIEGQERTIPCLIKIINKEKAPYRYNAALALGKTHSRKAIPILKKVFFQEAKLKKHSWFNFLSFDDHLETRAMCITSLMELMERNEIDLFFTDNFETFTQEDKLWTIYGCRNVQPDHAIEIIKKYFINDDNKKIKKLAHKNLLFYEKLAHEYLLFYEKLNK